MCAHVSPLVFFLDLGVLWRSCHHPSSRSSLPAGSITRLMAYSNTSWVIHAQCMHVMTLCYGPFHKHACAVQGWDDPCVAGEAFSDQHHAPLAVLLFLASSEVWAMERRWWWWRTLSWRPWCWATGRG